MKKIVIVFLVLLNISIFTASISFADDSKNKIQTRQEMLLTLDRLNKLLENKLEEIKKLIEQQTADQEILNKQMAEFDKVSSVIMKDFQQSLAKIKKNLAESDKDLKLLVDGLK
ncbi:hypothetical protein HZB04_03020 [Candidatus Wolfebacteria bacterium]|nr:hypothetical protein [Candidatus Wolfebacteria bacterium]